MESNNKKEGYSHDDFINPLYRQSVNLFLNPANPLLSLRIYKCDNCDYQCSLKKALHMHTRMHLADKVFKCGECGYQATSKGYLNKHLKTGHSIDSNSEKTTDGKSSKGDDEFKCELCNYTCDKSYVMKHHFSFHFSVRPFVCNKPFCMFSCAKLDELENHLTNHPYLKDNMRCKLCDYNINDKTKLNDHMVNIHANDNPFKCNICDYICSRTNFLWKHKQKHFGGEAVECHLCDYCCGSQITFQRHMSDHKDGLKPTCSLCSQEFDNKEQLVNHIVVHVDKPD